MSREVADGDAIRKATESLLRRAEVKGRLPTPVDDIVAAAGLTEAQHSLLSNLIIEEAPAHLRKALRKLKFKVRAVLDRKEREIHVDPGIHIAGRVAFKKLHEVTHDVLPWQRELGYADDDLTLSPSARQLFEQQANQGAAELLFQRTLFAEMAAQYDIGIAATLELAELFGASGHAAFRRFIETHKAPVAGVVIELSPSQVQPLAYRRKEVVCSVQWDERFGSAQSWPRLLRSPPYTFVDDLERARMFGDTVKRTFMLPDLANDAVNLNVETYCNQYQLFALIWVPQRARLRHRRIMAPGGRQLAS